MKLSRNQLTRALTGIAAVFALGFSGATAADATPQPELSPSLEAMSPPVTQGGPRLPGGFVVVTEEIAVISTFVPAP